MSELSDKFLTPKELSAELEKIGIVVTPRYLRAVRRYGDRIGDNPFAAPGVARPSAVLDWLMRHQEFKRGMGESQPDVGIQ